MPKYDDLGSWKIFLSLAESRSFSVTAEAFGVEPSTISRTLGTLENSLGQKLVDRSARPLELTPKGLWAVKRIAPIIRSHEKLINEMTEDSTGLEGQIRVSVAPGFATRYLVPMLARFSERYPNITFEIQEEAENRCRDYYRQSGGSEACDIPPGAEYLLATRLSRLHQGARHAA